MLISSILKNWYLQKKRNLPWRNTQNPYYIWVSEIILQQTRINQGIEYYNRFITRFPDIESLANASMDDVLKLWQGLGYYRRAKYLHEGANYVMEHFNGNLPSNHSELLKIKGIGAYTAAAIGSIAFKLPYPSVDGNVNRVISRIFGIHDPVNSSAGMRKIKEMATALLDKDDPGLSNQALMEFGALHCVPVSPDCDSCPVYEVCFARVHQQVHLLPVNTTQQRIRQRYFNYLFITDTAYQRTYIQQRSENDIWQGLFEFPLIETATAVPAKNLCASEEWNRIFTDKRFELIHISEEIKHKLSHQHIHTTFYIITSEHFSELNLKGQQVLYQNIHQYPVSRLMENFLNRAPFWNNFT